MNNVVQTKNTIDFSPPIYSIIIPHYHQMDMIYVALDSVLTQTYSHIELIIIDDGSPEFDKKAIEQYVLSNNPSNIKKLIILQNEINLGTTKTLNLACEAVTGSFIHIFAADDALADNDVVMNFIHFYDSVGEDAQIVSGLALMYDEHLEYMEAYFNTPAVMRNYQKMTSRQQYEESVQKCIYAMGATCMRSELFRKYGPFDERSKLVEDWFFWLMLTRQGVKVHSALFPVLLHRDGGVSHNPQGNTAPHATQYESDILTIQECAILPYLSTLPLSLQLIAFEKYVRESQGFHRVNGQRVIVSKKQLLQENPQLRSRVLKNNLLSWAQKLRRPASHFIFVMLLSATASLILSTMVPVGENPLATISAPIFAVLYPVSLILFFLGILIWFCCSVLCLFSWIIKRKREKAIW